MLENKNINSVMVHMDMGMVEDDLSEILTSLKMLDSSIKEVSNMFESGTASLLAEFKKIAAEVRSDLESISAIIERETEELTGWITSENEKQAFTDANGKFLDLLLDVATGRFTPTAKSPSAKTKGGNTGGQVLALPPGRDDEQSGGSGLLGIASNADMLTAGLADLTAAWDAEAIAKAASTAAQWAQNAAAVAWKGICAAASAVTTAFGAAMNFLTSPITLVVLGIAALIAIVVLLVKNWDTVKAALITGWEAVKQAFSVAAEWFNSNVIQPLAGFFTGLWDQICVIVTNVTTFISTKFQEFTLWIQTAIANVQAVFLGIGTFLQSVFAVDWTTQFGAFGEVLNAFFANVENIWNAVKMIFEGIVTFVQGVFAGDWEAAWDGTRQVFTGIWEGLEAAIKAPINGVIGLINGLVSAVVSGINGAIQALNLLRFTVPDWVPKIGGQSIGFNIGMISAPTIPYLAQLARVLKRRCRARSSVFGSAVMEQGFRK